MTKDQQLIELLIKRQDAHDQMIVSINDNLAGIREVLSKLELHDHRLNEHRQELNTLDVKVDGLVSEKDKSKTVMDILNRILILGIPSLIFAVFLMAGMLWYGINNPPTQRQIEALPAERVIKP